MILCLMRHGEAVGSSESGDAARALSDRGQVEARRAAQGLLAQGVRISRIFASPLRRAAETARIAAEVLGLHEVTTLSELASSGSRPRIDLLLVEAPEQQAWLLIGHHPDLTLLAEHLTHGSQPAPVFSTGAVLALDWDAQWSRARRLWYQPADESPAAL